VIVAPETEIDPAVALCRSAPTISPNAAKLRIHRFT